MGNCVFLFLNVALGIFVIFGQTSHNVLVPRTNDDITLGEVRRYSTGDVTFCIKHNRLQFCFQNVQDALRYVRKYLMRY